MASAEQQATTAAQAAEAAEAAEAVEAAAAVAEAHDAAPGVTETGTAAESRTAASSASTATATLIRIKRKRNEDPLDTLLVAESGTDKRLKSVADAKVFRLLESVDLAAFDLQKLDTVRQGSAHTDSLAALAFKDKSFTRMALQRLATPEKRREVIVASKLAEAKAARYKIVTQNRQQLKQGTLNVVDIHRDSGEQDESEADRRRNQLRDEITCNLMPMVREYLSLTEQPQPDSRDVDRRRGKHELGRIAADVESEQHAADANSQDDSDDVYDIYVHDHDLGVASALKSSKVGTLAVKADELAGMFLDENDLSSDSDDDSEDSNAEDYYANDYPDEDDEDDEFAYDEDQGDEDDDQDELFDDDDDSYYGVRQVHGRKAIGAHDPWRTYSYGRQGVHTMDTHGDGDDSDDMY